MVQYEPTNIQSMASFRMPVHIDDCRVCALLVNQSCKITTISKTNYVLILIHLLLFKKRYKLGEHCDWFKHDNFEDSTRIPLLLKPAKSASARWGITSLGKEITQLVEEIDIFPSLIDLAGLDQPGGLQGKSWVPLLADQTLPGKDIVFSQYPHYSQAHQHQVMGYSMRTHQWRQVTSVHLWIGRCFLSSVARS